MSAGQAIALTLALLAGALALLPGRAPPQEGWSWRVDPALLLAVVLGVGLAQQAVLADAALPVGGVASSDLTEYCGSVVAWSRGLEGAYTWNRSRLHGMLWGPLVPHLGPLDALLTGAMVGSAGITAGLYLWGRGLHGRLAGAAAAVFGTALTPLVMQSRALTFYPLSVAGFTLAAGSGCLALRLRAPWAFALAGACSGLALLADLRGLLWALPCLGLAALGTLSGSWRRWLPRVVLLALPMWGSWFAARATYTAQTVSLEDQLHVNQRLRELDLAHKVDEGLYADRTAFVYGWTPITEVPATLRYLQREGALIPTPDEARSFWAQNFRRHVSGWVLPAGLGFAVAVWGLRRRPLLLLGLVGSALPFVVILRSGVLLLFAQPRFLAQGIAVLGMALGVGFAVVVQGALPRAGEAPPGTPAWRGLLAVGALAALTLGLPAEPIGPHAAWRGEPLIPEGLEELLCMLREADTGARSCPVLPGGSTDLCLDGLREAHQAGRGPRAEALWALSAQEPLTLEAE